MGFAACVCGVKRTSIIHIRKRQRIYSDQAIDYSCPTQVTGVHIPIGAYTKLTSNFAFHFSLFCCSLVGFRQQKHLTFVFRKTWIGCRFTASQDFTRFSGLFPKVTKLWNYRCASGRLHWWTWSDINHDVPGTTPRPALSDCTLFVLFMNNIMQHVVNNITAFSKDGVLFAFLASDRDNPWAF